MPFRIPDDYKQLHFSIHAKDPFVEDVAKYVIWLRSELALCKTYLSTRKTRKRPVAPKEPAAK